MRKSRTILLILSLIIFTLTQVAIAQNDKYGNSVRINVPDAWVLMADPTNFEDSDMGWDIDNGDGDIMDDSLILYLSFDELRGNSVIDHSSHENHGTLVGSPQLVNGRFGKALRFNGESDWVEVPHDDSLTVDENVTVMAWIHTPRHHGPAGALWQAIIAKGNNPQSYSVYTEHNGALHMSVDNFQGSNSIETVQLNTWQHVVTQMDNGVQKYWINGESAGNFPIAASLPGLVDNSSVRIGNSHDTAPAHAWMRHFLGIIDEVRVWNRALSEAEIREQMQMGLNTISGTTERPVNIPDPNLRAVIEEVLGKASGATITAADMLRLTELRANKRGIENLTGLEFATNLTDLRLALNNIVDVSALANLTQLTYLGLSYGNNIVDVSALANLTNLTSLYLNENNIVDVSALANLTNLTSLYLNENNIVDVSALANLTNLTSLYLARNNIRDISVLARLTKLTELNLSSNNIRDVSALARLTKLTYLGLAWNNIRDISVLARLTKLTELNLSSNEISDFSPIAGLVPNLTEYSNEDQRVESVVDLNTAVTIPDPNLRAALEEALGKASGATITRADMLTLTELDAIDRGIQDLTGIEFATNLTRLGLGFNQVSDVSGLVSLKNLTGLSLFGNDVSDVSALASLKNLTGLSLFGNDVSDVSALASLINLTELYFYSNDVSDVSALVSLKNLTELDFSNNQVSDVSALVSLKNLERLHFSNNQVSDISALVSLKNLRLLYLGDNEVSDISVLGGLTDMRFLSLDGNDISDISALRGLTNLEKLYLRDNDISDVSPLASLRNLTELHLSDNEISDFSPIAGLVPNLTEYSNEDQRVEGVVDLKYCGQHSGSEPPRCY